MAMCKVSSSVHFVTRSVSGGHEGSARPHWVPNTDVYATDNGLVVKVELAGMRSEHLEITVEGNRLRISGNRPDGCRAAKVQLPGDGDQLWPLRKRSGTAAGVRS